jgi:hypothetical protein
MLDLRWLSLTLLGVGVFVRLDGVSVTCFGVLV